ncbi:MAG: hypothetical protein E3K36_04860 [Candidatus Brocadia sp.]|nr:hypothetical protein [Candidatus Brocadia sp.]
MENKEPEETGKKICLSWKDILACYIAPLGSIIVAIAIGISGFLGSSYLRERAASKARTEKGYLTVEALRIYSELMSKREVADNELYKEMFDSIMRSYSEADKMPTEELLLNLKLLAYNFNELLNIKPFFLFLRNKILNSYDLSREEYLEDLKYIAQWVVTRQIWVLEGDGKWFSRTIDLDLLHQNRSCLLLKDETLILEGIERNFKIAVLETNTAMKEIKVRLEIKTPKESNHAPVIKVAEFWIGFFDFPMIDNIRLSHDQRCAVVLDQLSETSADITLVTFPGALAGMKGKPYYQKAVQHILETGEVFGTEGLKKTWSLE